MMHPVEENRIAKAKFEENEEMKLFFENTRAAGGPPEGMRVFGTGANRTNNEGKLDFKGFLSPIALKAFAEYMHKHRTLPDGTVRNSDNWKKGIPLDAYMESMWRHFFAVWHGYENDNVQEEDLCALFFNVQGFLHEFLKPPAEPKQRLDYGGT